MLAECSPQAAFSPILLQPDYTMRTDREWKEMRGQYRRMAIIALVGMVFGLSTSAVITSASGSNVRFYHGPEVACVLNADPICGGGK